MKAEVDPVIEEFTCSRDEKSAHKCIFVKRMAFVPVPG